MKSVRMREESNFRSFGVYILNEWPLGWNLSHSFWTNLSPTTGMKHTEQLIQRRKPDNPVRNGVHVVPIQSVEHIVRKKSADMNVFGEVLCRQIYGQLVDLLVCSLHISWISLMALFLLMCVLEFPDDCPG